MRHEKVFVREDGSTVTIVNIASTTDDLGFDVFAFVDRAGATKEYYYPKLSPHKSLGGLSVDEYIKHGRQGLLSVARPHELIKTNLELREKLKAQQSNCCS